MFEFGRNNNISCQMPQFGCQGSALQIILEQCGRQKVPDDTAIRRIRQTSSSACRGQGQISSVSLSGVLAVNPGRCSFWLIAPSR
ncbi:hypothetical protein RRG08_041921 [Elysia crispata]|uniref:Uncharacterized protein n=1 Tax=Elysia crispata TaxID=231223 RepID=A0AAE0XXX4_9GAST|nr:hypothetical protein RRG08_041921 [Elysia crispata]